MSGLAAKAPRPLVLSAHQPTYLPWCGLFSKIAQADLFVLFDTVQMEDSGFENRVRIKTPTGPQWLTVPVRRGREKKLYEIEIANDQPWQRKHWRTIELNYAKAPFFGEYAPTLALEYYQRKPFGTLADLNASMIRWFLTQLDIRTPIVRASHCNFTGEKSALVLDMCQKLGATEYLFGAKGRDYADVPAFEAAGIKVHFQDYQHPEYPQLHGAFVPGLSVIDLLMNVGGPAAARYFVRQSVSTGAKVSA